MLVNYLRNVVKMGPVGYRFGIAVSKDQVNYYDVLQVDESATPQTIYQSYSELTTGLTPQLDSIRFKELNEAFVILTDNKTRDAYDSLLKVMKTNYLSAEEQRIPATRSYLAQRQEQKAEQFKKKINIDEFGRYQGGLPQRRGQARGNSRGPTGTLHRLAQVQQAFDRHPQFNNVDTEKAESYKNFVSNERQTRSIKWPWFSFQVDYHFFNFGKFRRSYWPKIQLLILLFYILPTFFYAYERYQKGQLTSQLKAKSKKVAEIKEEPIAQAH